MELGQGTLTIIAIASAVIATLAFAMVVTLGRRLRRVRRLMRSRPKPAQSPAEPRHDDWDTVGVVYELAELRDTVATAVQRIGMVRFDAFEDMGGELSFAAALLDAEGSGLVLSSINGRSETRIYAKPIENGASRYNLSDEETEAIRRALHGDRR